MYRVVIADDEQIIRNGLKKLIESYNIGLSVVATAENGKIALDIIKEYNPEIIIMDINMPFINGLDIIDKIKKIDKNTIVIIISGYDKFDYAQRAIELGVFKYLLKPIDHIQFKEVLLEAIDLYALKMWRLNQISEKLGPLGLDTDVGNQAVNYIKENFTNNEISLKYVADALYISDSYLTKVVKEKTGNTFTDYLNKLRIHASIKLLLDKDIDYAIKDISRMVGYSSQHYFSRAFKNYTGMSPTEYKKENI